MYLILIALLVFAGWAIQIYLHVTKKLSNPHQIVELAMHGNRWAQAYMVIFACAVFVFLILVFDNL